MELIEGAEMRDEVVEVLITHSVGHGIWHDGLSLRVARFLDDVEGDFAEFDLAGLADSSSLIELLGRCDLIVFVEGEGMDAVVDGLSPSEVDLVFFGFGDRN